MRNIIVDKLNQTPIEDLDIEIVERKGIGHPDSISDGIAESVSRALCKEYMDKLGEGKIHHHNTDQVEITAGESNPEFGGGEIIKPIDFLLSGRGVREYDGVKFAVDRVAIEAAKEYLNNFLINFNTETDAIVECKIGQGSGDLVDVFDRNEAIFSNDTSFGVGYAPFSEVENIVLGTENLINSKSFKKGKFVAVGEDIKVMGLRENDNIVLTIAAAMISKHISSVEEYVDVKESLIEEVEALAIKKTDRSIEINVNTADANNPKTEKDCYLTVTGTSAEMGDDGSVGRGNRANGLITPNRPMSMEATSGKNPINHVGKIYNILSNQIANDIVSEIEAVKQVNIMILSQIGKAIDQPKAATSQLILEDGYKLEDVSKNVEVIIDTWLSDISSITKGVINGEYRTF
jgi:S-adenosylmethionine synthetase